jgi:lipopolysaccharide export system permease protein
VRILTRYIFKESATYFCLTLLVFTSVLLTVRILKFTNLIVNKGVEVSQIGMVFLSVIPTFLEIAVPMAVLLGIMMAFARLSGDSEIIVLRSSGVSLNELIKPIFVFGVVVSFISLFISLELRPWGYRQLSRTLFEIARTKSTAGLDAGIFNKLGHLTLYAENISHHTGELEYVLIDDKRDQSRRRIIISESGKIVSDEKRQTISIHLYDGVIHETQKDKYMTTKFETNSIIMHPDEIYNPDATEGQRRNRERNLVELNRLLWVNRSIISKKRTGASASEALSPQEQAVEQAEGLPHLSISQQLQKLRREMSKLQIEKGRRFSMPFAALLLALIAMPLGIQPPRAQKSWGVTLSIVLGLIVFIFYYALLSVGIALAERGTWNAYLGLWIPNAAIGIITVYALRKMGSEKWQSIAHALEHVMNFIARKLNLGEPQ